MAAELTRPVQHLSSVLHNGFGRYVIQLQRITLHFSKTAGAHRGIRDYIENHVTDFAKIHPSIVVYVMPNRMVTKSHLIGEYLCNENLKVVTDGMTEDQVQYWMELLRTRSGIPDYRYHKRFSNPTPSVQGVWNPLYNKPLQTISQKFIKVAKDNSRFEIRTESGSPILQVQPGPAPRGNWTRLRAM